MLSDSSNDNRDGRVLPPSNASGEAAMLLVESLLHGLIARKLITVADALEVVDVALDVAGEMDHPSVERRDARDLLAAVGESLRRDLGSD